MSSADFHEISPRLGAPSPKYGGPGDILFHQNGGGRSSGTEASSLRNIQALSALQVQDPSEKQNTSKSSTVLDLNKAPLSMEEVRKVKHRNKVQEQQEDPGPSHDDEFYPKCGNTLLTDGDIEVFDDYVNHTISSID